MTPTTRLKAIGGIIFLSAIYAVLVDKSPATARAVALWYIAVMLTLLVLIQCWRKPR